MPKKVINETPNINGFQEPQKYTVKDLEEILKEGIKIAMTNETFEKIERMVPPEPGGDSFVRDVNGKVLKGKLICQSFDFETARDIEIKGSYIYNRVMKDIYLLDNGKLRFFEKKILCKYGDLSTLTFFRVAIEEVNLDGSDFEFMLHHLNSSHIKQ